MTREFHVEFTRKGDIAQVAKRRSSSNEFTYSTYQTTFKRLQILQKRAVRIIIKSPYLSHTDPLLTGRLSKNLSVVFASKINISQTLANERLYQG